MMGELVPSGDSIITGWCLENSDGDEEFCSCCAEEEDWQESSDESVAGDHVGDDDGGGGGDDIIDKFSLKLFFKGVSVSRQLEEGSQSGISGIGVVMERPPGVPVLQIQKKLNLCVEEVITEHLALMDGLLEALRNGVKKVFAFTDSNLVYHQISEAKDPDDQLVTALGQRILELASKLEVFVLKLVPTSELKKSLALAQEAAGVSDYANGTNALILSERFCCPFPNCSALLHPSQLFASASCSGPVNSNSVECSACGRLVCISCHVPWHASMTCAEYQNNPQEERDNEDAALHHLAQENNWRRCERCLRVIDLVQGCYHLTCRCGHEFCYSCGSEYIGGQQACHCAHHDEEGEEQQVTLSNQDSELWRWDSFELPTSALDAYTEQERSQLALIQRFLAGGLGLSDLNACQSPPRCSDSFVDTIKDLHQLPWLERFVSVISDNYHEDYIQ